ncbi:MAG: hypothetical protein RLY93_07220 [Sumerlaeia bacterium]
MALNLPVIHLDQHYHGPNWQEPPPGVWQARLDKLLAGERWIMDGNYAGSLDRRLRRADAVVWLDFGRAVCLPRLIRRSLTYWRRERPDTAPGCRESFGWGYLDFLRFAWTWNDEVRPGILAALEQGDTPVWRLKTPKEAAELTRETQAAESPRPQKIRP